MEVICNNCGKLITKPKSAIHKTNFCNKVCHDEYQRNHSKKAPNNCVCDYCGKEFHKKPCSIKTTNFCSKDCFTSYRDEHTTVREYTCEMCGNTYKASDYHVTHYNSRFCSKQCMDKWQRRYYITTKCSCCGKEIHVDKTRQLYSKTNMFFCSNKCANKVLLSPEYNPNYRGISDISDSLRHYYEMNQRGLIFKKYNKSCCICGNPGEQVHHLYPFYKIIEELMIKYSDLDYSKEEDRREFVERVILDTTNKFNDLSNLVCVCKKCHYEVFHSKGWRD